MGGVTALGSDWPAIRARLAGRRECGALHDRVGRDDRPRDAARRADRRLRAARALVPQAAAQHGARLAARGARERARARRCRPRWRPGDPRRRMGVACGSSVGSTPDIRHFVEMLQTGQSGGLNANSYVRMMPHTAAANVGIFFGAERPHHPDLERLHLRQPGHRLRLRGDPRGPPDPDARRRRRGTVPERGDRVRYPVRDEPAQRPAARRRRGPTIATATGSSSVKARRCSCSRTRACARARGAHPRRGRRLRQQLRRRARHPARWKARCGASWSSRSRTPASRPAHRLRQRPWHRDRARRHRRDSRDAALLGNRDADQLAEELHRAHARRLRRDRGMVHDRDDEGAAGTRRRSISTTSIPAAASSTTSRAAAATLDVEYVMTNNFAFGGVNTSLIFARSA